MTRNSSKNKSDKELGMNSNITRRDFLNSTLLGMGGALLGAAAPFAGLSSKKDYTIKKNSWSGYGAVGDYANSSGNTRDVMESAHKIRDGGYEDLSSIDFTKTGEIFDLVVVGGGMSGLGAAHFFKKNTAEEQRCLILENHPIFGGEAKRNEFNVKGQHLIAPQGSNDTGIPKKGSGSFSDKLYDELEIPRKVEFQNWGSDLKPLKFSLDNYAQMAGIAESKVDVGYYFDKEYTGSSPKWINNIWRNDLKNAPFSNKTKKDLLTARYSGSDQNDEAFLRDLDSITYKEYLEKRLELSPEVTKYFEPLCGLLLGGRPNAVSAFAAVQQGMPGTPNTRGKDTSLPLSFPGGNTVFSRYFIKDLIPGAIEGNNTFGDIINHPVNFNALDKEDNKIQMRLGSTVVRVEHEKDPSNSDYVLVTYEKGGNVYQLRARSVVMASGGWINKHIIRDLPENIKEAYEQFIHAPALIMNIALTNWRFLYDLGITAARWFSDGFGFTCNIRRPMIVGDHHPPLHPDKPIVLTLYTGPSYTSGSSLRKQNINARWKIFGTSFEDYERQIRKQMLKQFGSTGFDPKNDIEGIILNRWGHARLAQQPGWYFGTVDRTAPREVVSQGFGRLSIGHSELNGPQHMTGAIKQGYRAAEQALNRI